MVRPVLWTDTVSSDLQIYHSRACRCILLYIKFYPGVMVVVIHAEDPGFWEHTSTKRRA